MSNRFYFHISKPPLCETLCSAPPGCSIERLYQMVTTQAWEITQVFIEHGCDL